MMENDPIAALIEHWRQRSGPTSAHTTIIN